MLDTNKIILNEIQNKREKMIECAQKQGFNSEETIRYSQELDWLIYLYQCSLHFESRKKEELKEMLKKFMLVWANTQANVQRFS
ncbi:aspartyl-phosphate phosphatase Spo0E family protein [Bacillus sp. 03113]|uniref:aspartyl-phosphate phosphatase Spo0E family protein n=1 Tax=Bacillus sp. 03113 TaxID=2578211 RepID=UPI0011418BD4|nr:aspartyl-phosphate phosphatase Spo0E family protein [Bacillus sp. 03113]